jgi:hypothetical protein
MAFSRLRCFSLGLLWLLLFPRPLRAQGLPPEPREGGDPAALIGLSLGELWERYGPPLSVHPVRGAEPWQDDVVFSYPSGDFYIHRDRVWQLGLRDAYGVKLGDPRGLLSLLFGEGLEEFEDRILRPLFGWNWPLKLRVNISGPGQVSAIYIYRSDF